MFKTNENRPDADFTVWVSLQVESSNPSELARLVRNADENNNFTTPNLVGTVPLSMLIEIGIYKLRRDYLQYLNGKQMLKVTTLIVTTFIITTFIVTTVIAVTLIIITLMDNAYRHHGYSHNAYSHSPADRWLISVRLSPYTRPPIYVEA